MGPRASAAFVTDVYELAARHASREQVLPRIVLHSDPSLADRTWALQSGMSIIVAELRKALQQRIAAVVAAGATDVVVCCFTAHLLVDETSVPASVKLHSLSARLKTALATSGPALLLSTSGAAAHLAALSANLIRVTNRDQMLVDQIIADLKVGRPVTECEDRLWHVAAHYGVDTVVLGCTEMYLIARQLKDDIFRQWAIVDVVGSLARKIAQLDTISVGSNR